MRYSLIVADTGLPADGIGKVVARIAQMEASRRPIVLVLADTPESGRSLDVEIVQILLRRPVDVGQLVDLIGSCLRNAGGRRKAADTDADRPHATI